MNPPEDAFETQLRVRMDQLADSVSAGDGIDGTQLYRQGVRRKRQRGAAASALIAAAVALVIVAAAIWLPGTIDGTEQRPSDHLRPVEQNDMFQCSPSAGRFATRSTRSLTCCGNLQGAAVCDAEAERRRTDVGDSLHDSPTLTVERCG